MFSPEFDYSEYETPEEFIAVIASALGGLKFYSVIVAGNDIFSGLFDEVKICTFRGLDAVKEVYEGSMITEYNLADIAQHPEEYLPIYCVELHSSYKYVDILMKDMMISKLSGMMEAEVK